MFKKIDIKKFGLYKDFKWPDDLPEFGRLNVIYGRNYQGKTTLSRIFDSVGGRMLHHNYRERRDLFQIEYEQLDNKEVKECLGKLENHQELVY